MFKVGDVVRRDGRLGVVMYPSTDFFSTALFLGDLVPEIIDPEMCETATDLTDEEQALVMKYNLGIDTCSACA